MKTLLLLMLISGAAHADEYDARIDARIREREQIREEVAREERGAAAAVVANNSQRFEDLFRKLRDEDLKRQRERANKSATIVKK